MPNTMTQCPTINTTGICLCNIYGTNVSDVLNAAGLRKPILPENESYFMVSVQVAAMQSHRISCTHDVNVLLAVNAIQDNFQLSRLPNVLIVRFAILGMTETQRIVFYTETFACAWLFLLLFYDFFYFKKMLTDHPRLQSVLFIQVGRLLCGNRGLLCTLAVHDCSIVLSNLSSVSHVSSYFHDYCYFVGRGGDQ